MKLTVKEYASQFNISVQAVYQKLNKGLLKQIKENGRKYVVVDSVEVKAVENSIKEVDKSLVKELLKQLKSRDKEIKRLTKQLEKCSKGKEEVLLSYISELKQLQISQRQSEEIIEIKPEKKKRKKKKNTKR